VLKAYNHSQESQKNYKDNQILRSQSPSAKIKGISKDQLSL